MKLDQFLYEYPVFRYEEFAEYKKQNNPSLRPKIIQNALSYHIKSGNFMHIRKYIYASIPPNETPETILIDPYLLAAKMAPDSTLAYHTALELHGVAHSIFEKFVFLTAQKCKPFVFQNRLYQPSSIPNALANKDFGKVKMVRQGMEIQITSLARTFVDIIDRMELSGGWEEVIRSVNKISILNVDEAIDYCLMLKKNILAAKVGFFLEQRQGAFKVENEKLERLLKLRPNITQYLIKNHYIPNQYLKKWNLIIPSVILNQTWEEANHDIII